MNPGYIRFGIAILVTFAFFLGCDSSVKSGDAAQDENMQSEGGYSTGDEDKNIQTEEDQWTDAGSGDNPSEDAQSTNNENDGNQGTGYQSEDDKKSDTFSVSGTLSGLITGASIVLQNNGVDDLAVSSNGPFTFTIKLADGAAYRVSIRTQPEGQICEVSKGEGLIDEADVTDVTVTCVDPEVIDPEVTDSDWAQVSVGSSHACGIRTDRRLFCWGNNENGQLGNNSTENSPVPVQENTTASDWAQVSAGNGHTCAVKTDGRLYCWGSNQYGKIGNNAYEDSLVPAQEDTLASDWAQVSAGSGHTCAVKSDGRLFCWGLGNQLGNNSQSASLVPVQEGTAASDWAQVSAGFNESCALKTDGRLFCWGGSTTSWFGHFYSIYAPLPVQENTKASDWAQVSVGAQTCAVKVAGRLFCWNNASPAAEVTWEEHLTPVPERSASIDWTQVSTGWRYTCAVKSDGQLFCDGSGVQDPTTELDNQDTGYLATADWAQVSAGDGFACAVKVDGQLFCWGEGGYGQLGNNRVSSDSPVPLQEQSAATDWNQVTSGDRHTCAVKSDGRLFCWGRNYEGQLGNNSTASSLEPEQEYTAADDWVQVSAANHTCAVKGDGRLFCWGEGTSGQLGNDSVEISLIPVQENTKAVDWTQVSAGRGHTCAVKTDGELFCWGSNRNGMLGNNSTENSPVPVQEDTRASDWAQVTSGDEHTCAIKTDGRLFCWGDSARGQLGNNSQSVSLVPVQEDTKASDWSQLSASYQYACASKSDGRLFCWGASQNRLSNGADALVPLQENTMASDWAQVATGDYHTCAIKTDGRLFCWGRNYDGQLGNNFGDYTVFAPPQEATGATDWGEVSAGAAHTCATKTDGRLFCWGNDTMNTFGPVTLTN